MNKLPILASLLGLMVLSAGVQAADPPADCTDRTEVKTKSRTLNKMSTLMVSLLTLEKQGEANFRPEYAALPGQCVWERFATGGANVTAMQSPVQTDKQSLAWRFVTDAAEPREIIVIYDAMASLVAEKTVYFAIENRKGDISYYEMFRDPPAYAVLKPLVTGILDGSARALATVRWPKGAKEPVIDAMDMKRLK